ncbi:MAG: S1 RNA-binding domain-containing protein [Candidatus Woesearchaeota archaeon]
MYYRKKGFPEESEIVMCTVTSVQFSSVFVNIDEYDLQGMIHISEIAAGRIRNIRDYVKEGKKIVCKVLRVNKEKKQVDLSLRRVNEKERKEKVNQIKLEQKAEAILDHVAKENKIETKKLYDELSTILLNDYEYLHNAFEDIVVGNLKLKELKLKIDEKVLNEIEELVNLRFKPQHIEIKGVITLTSYESNGVEIIKEALLEAEKTGCEIKYLGGGKYEISVKSTDYKEAETTLKKATEIIEQKVKNKAYYEFKR